MNGFLAPKQNAVGGGGEALGDATVWPTAATWAALASITGPRDGDQAPVTDADGSGTTGVAQWSASDDEWQLLSADFAGSLFLDFPNPIVTGATCTAVFDDGVRSYVYTVATVAAGAGGGTLALWLPDEVAAGTPTVIGYFDGDEDGPTLTARGNAAVGTVATTGTEIELLSAGASTSRLLQSTSVATADRYYFRGLYRGAKTGGSSIISTVYLAEGGANDLLYIGSQSSGISFLSSGLANVSTLRVPVTSIPGPTSTPVLCEVVHHGMTVLSELYADGAMISAYRGDLQSGATGDFVIAPLANGGGGGTSQILASSQVVLTW